MNKLSKPLLIGVGVLFSSASFIYEYALQYQTPVVTAVIMALDVALLLLNIFYLSFSINEKTGRSIINSVLYALLYFAGISGAIMVFAEENASLHLLLGTLKILVYLCPMIIVLLPVIYLLAQIMD